VAERNISIRVVHGAVEPVRREALHTPRGLVREKQAILVELLYPALAATTTTYYYD
jgi:hypothetical protein